MLLASVATDLSDTSNTIQKISVNVCIHIMLTMTSTGESSSDTSARTRALMRGRTKRMNWKSNVSQFKKFIASVPPSVEEETLIRSSPFAWVLDIPDIIHVRPLVQNMFDNWDCTEKCFIFQDKKLHFTKTDVSLILGLPDDGLEVPMNNEAPSGELYLQYFVEADCSNKHLEDLLKTSRSPDNLGSAKVYCQLFILYFFSCVFFTTTSSKPRIPMRSLIDCVEDFENLGRYNWCEALYTYMAPQMESIGMGVTLRPKADVVGGSTRPMLKGFAHLLAVWMCEHLCILPPHVPHALPRMLRWRWSSTNVRVVKKMVDGLVPDKIIVDLIPAQSELHLVHTASPPRSSASTPQPETQVDARGMACPVCQENAEIVSTLSTKLVEARCDFESTSLLKEATIKQQEKKIQELLQELEEVSNRKHNEIIERDDIIAEKEALIAEKDSLILELQLHLQSRDVEGLQSQPIQAVQTQQPSSAYTRRKVCVRKKTLDGLSPPSLRSLPPAWFSNIPKRRRVETLIVPSKAIEYPSVDPNISPAEPNIEQESVQDIKGKSIVEEGETEISDTGTQVSTDKQPTLDEVKQRILEQAYKEFTGKMDPNVGECLLKLKKIDVTVSGPVWKTDAINLNMDSFLTIFDWNVLTHGDCISAYFSVLAEQCKVTDKPYYNSIFCGAGFPDMFNMMYAQAFEQTFKTPGNPIRYIFCPIIRDEHCHLLVVDLENSEFIHYNSLSVRKAYTTQFEETVEFFKKMHPSYYDNWHPGLAEKFSNANFSVRRVQGPRQSSS